MKLLESLKITFILLFVFNFGISYSQTEIIFNSPPPDADFIQLKLGNIDPPGLVKLKVPPYKWSYGCACTSAAMLIGYYDQNGYPNLYKGYKNGGVAPCSNYPYWDNALNTPGKTNCNNSISASKKGFDLRTTNGHVDDFWYATNSQNTDPHPWIIGIPPHPFGVQPCVADYMGTSQDYYNLADSHTSFFLYPDNTKTINYTSCEQRIPKKKDGLRGLREYIESCGYIVLENYSQNIFGYGGIQDGFTFNNFKAEIDAGRPVLIHFQNHMCIGIGYIDSTQKIRIYTTWSENPWDMEWGSNLTASQSAGSLPMIGVSVLKLQPPSIPTGIYDKVEIRNPLAGTTSQKGTVPNNTNYMSSCSNASFYANFSSGSTPITYANSFDWSLVLYHSTGSYTCAQQSGILPNTYTPNGSGQGCVWQPMLGTLPIYAWSYDYNGNIFGHVNVSVLISDGTIATKQIPISVSPHQTIQNTTYNSTNTINATCAKLMLTNVIVNSPAQITINTNGYGIQINAPIQVNAGSTLKINN